MRLAYILAVVIAATLHASGTALTTTKDSRVMIENGASPELVDATHADGGRLLRRVEKDEAIVEEERAIKNIGAWLKKHTPFTAKWREARKVKNAQKHMARFRRNRENMRAAGGEPL